MKIISRKDALALGLGLFYTGEPCRNGHAAQRRVDSYNCVQCAQDRSIAWAKANPDKIQKHLKKYRTSPNGVKKISASRKLYLQRHKNKISITYKKWYELNGQRKNSLNRTKEANARRRKRYIERHRTEIQFRLQTVLRGRLKNAIRDGLKGGSAIKQLGCSIEFLRDYLESKFTQGMTWKNYGRVWQIDHNKPLSAFDLTNKHHIQIVCNYTNLQPLLKRENLSKGDKIIQPFQLPLALEFTHVM